MRIDIQKWKENVLANKKRLAIPIMTHPGIDLIGKTPRDVVTDGQSHFEAIEALNNKYSPDACCLIMDLTVEAEAFGAEIIFPENDIPHVKGSLVHDYLSVERLNIPDLTSGRIPQYLLANRLTAKNIPNKPVFGGVIGPFSLAGRLFGISELMIACYTETDTVTLLLEKCTTFLINYCNAIKEQGVDGVVIAEPVAGLLSNADCSTFSSQYIKKIVHVLQNNNFFIILHNCGNKGHCTEAMVETDTVGYHFGNSIDMIDALQGCPPSSLVMGNIDPVSFKTSTPEQIKLQTGKLLLETSEFPNFILSSGCDVPPNALHSNIEAFYEALHEYNEN